MTLDWLLLALLGYGLSCLSLAVWLEHGSGPLPSWLRTALAIYVAPAATIVAAPLDLVARAREE